MRVMAHAWTVERCLESTGSFRMILCCMLLVPGCSAGLDEAIHSSAMDPESANTLISRLCAAGLDVTAPTARDYDHSCGHGHDHHTNDVCLGRRDYPLGLNVSSGFAQVNIRPGAPPPEKELFGAACGPCRIAQVGACGYPSWSTTEREGAKAGRRDHSCLLYTSPSPRD